MGKKVISDHTASNTTGVNTGSAVNVDSGSEIDESPTPEVYNVSEIEELAEIPDSVRYVKLMHNSINGDFISELDYLLDTNKKITHCDIFVGNMGSRDIDHLDHLCIFHPGVEVHYFEYLDTES